MLDESRDAAPPRWGPAFLRLTAWPYRLEMAVFTIGLIAVLVWRFVVGDLNVVATVFWFLWPDLVAFVPIGVAVRGGRRWPSWGPALYNAAHSFLVVVPVIAVGTILAGRIEWAILGWAGHITLDRAVGYHLRARNAVAVGNQGTRPPFRSKA